MSHPTWVRGLKLKLIATIAVAVAVASYMGAWIETLKDVSALSLTTSHPTWVRGLKPS